MADLATFLGPGGSDPSTAIRATVTALTTTTTGDMLYIGQGYRGRIRERTFAGVDVNGAPFDPYSTKGPIYFSPNRSSTSGRTPAGRAARATAAKGRHEKTGRIGVRTATGIKYESYAAMKGALGRAGVDLYGAEQHTHMLDTMMVKAGGNEVAGGGADFGSEFEAFSGNQPCSQLAIGFYGPEEERARGNNEGTGKGGVKREFFALNPADLAWGEKSVGERMLLRANAGSSPSGGAAPLGFTGTDDWVGF